MVACVAALEGDMQHVSLVRELFQDKHSATAKGAGELSKTLKPDLLRALVGTIAKVGQCKLKRLELRVASACV